MSNHPTHPPTRARIRPSRLAVAAALGALAVVTTIIVSADSGELPRMLGGYYDIPGGDKLGHFVLIGGLAFLADGALVGRRFRLGHFELPGGSSLVLIAVTLEEISQLFLQHRTFSMTDLLCNYAGIVVAIALRAMSRSR